MKVDDGVIGVELEGATEEQLRGAVAAARKVFDDAGVDPSKAAHAAFRVEGVVEDDGTPSDEDLALMHVWTEADEAVGRELVLDAAGGPWDLFLCETPCEGVAPDAG